MHFEEKERPLDAVELPQRGSFHLEVLCEFRKKYCARTLKKCAVVAEALRVAEFFLVTLMCEHCANYCANWKGEWPRTHVNMKRGRKIFYLSEKA